MLTTKTVFLSDERTIFAGYANVVRPLEELKKYEAMLSLEEAMRSRRFRSALDRDRYFVFHGALRSLLGKYLSCEPRQVDIRSGANGKPTLFEEGRESVLQFSMSHSGTYVAYALGRFKNIGVDIEEIKPIHEMRGIIEQHFTKRETAALLASPKELRLQIFYRFWTRKEAVLKAQGEGLLRGLDSVEVAGEVRDGLRKVEVTGEAGDEKYSVFDIDGPAGYAAAVAIKDPISGLQIQVDYIPIEEF